MKILFNMEEQVHQFRIQGSIAESDLTVLRESLFRFFDSNPAYTIVDLSGAEMQIPHARLHTLILEIKSLACSKNLNLVVSETASEARVARQSVLELALKRQVESLQAKLELREKIRKDAEILLAENAKLKETVAGEMEKLETLKQGSNTLFSPILEKLWSEK